MISYLLSNGATGSGSAVIARCLCGQSKLTMDEWVNKVGEDREEAVVQDMLGHDDFDDYLYN